MAVLIPRAILFRVYIRAPSFRKLPGQNTRIQASGQHEAYFEDQSEPQDPTNSNRLSVLQNIRGPILGGPIIGTMLLWLTGQCKIRRVGCPTCAALL